MDKDLKIKAWIAGLTSAICLVATICFWNFALLLGVMWPLIALFEAYRAKTWKDIAQRAVKLVDQYQWLLDSHVNEDAGDESGERWKQEGADDVSGR